MAALIEQAGEALARAHSLFGDPPESGGSAATREGSRLSGTGGLVRAGWHDVTGLSGDFASHYAVFAGGAGAALDGLAGADNRLSDQLDDVADSDHSGRRASAAIINSAAADTAGLVPLSRTPAGEKALIAALRARIAQQQRVIAVCLAHDARLAALLRSLVYTRATETLTRESVGIPWGSGRFGGRSPGGTGRISAMPASGDAGRAPRVVTVASHRPNPQDVPDGPGAVAVNAALSRQGCPYVWGAKGPSVFDCSGLTKWSWEQAGVQLGGDTYSQINEGIPVSPGEVRAGDLIFPASSFGEDGRGGPGHVQLAISPTEVIHAPQTGDVVRIAPMPSSFVARRPMAGGYAED